MRRVRRRFAGNNVAPFRARVKGTRSIEVSYLRALKRRGYRFDGVLFGPEGKVMA